MVDSSSRPADGPLIVRGARASSVIVQRLAPDNADAFLDWQRGITEATAEFPGYHSTEIYPPSGADEQEWVVIIHFDNAQHLQSWLDSAKRVEWMAKLPCETRNYRLTTLPSGFGAWFAGLDDQGKPPPHWKVFLTVLFGLYPTVMLLTIFLAPHTSRFGIAVAFLISNICSVSFLEWLGMPVIRKLLGRWLKADGKNDPRTEVIGTLLIVWSLILMAYLFHLVI